MSAKIYDSTLQAFKEVDPPKIKVWLEETEPVALVPVMTSDTTPSGVASLSPVYTVTGYDFSAWQSFNPTSVSVGCIQGTSGYIQYEFTTSKTVQYITAKELGNQNYVIYYTFMKDVTFQVSNDGTNWTQVGSASFSSVTSGKEYEATIATPTSGKYFRINISNNNYGSSAYTECGKLQFYGN